MALKFGELYVDIGADTSGLKRADREITRTAKGMTKSFISVGRAISAALSGIAVRNTILLADKMNMLDQQIKNVTNNAEQFNKIRDGIRGIAAETGSSIESVTRLSQALIIAGESIGATDDQVVEMTSNLNKLGAIGGASGEAMKNSMRQFGQAMTGGIVRAEEFNSIIENTPLIAKAIAEGMGKNVGELRKMVIEGKVLSKDVFKSLESQTDKINKKFAAMPITVDRATGMISNSIATVIQKIDEEIEATDTLAEAMKGVSDSINDLVGDSEKLNAAIETTKDIVEGLTFLLLVKMGSAFSGFATKMAASVAGSALFSAAIAKNTFVMKDMGGAMQKVPVKIGLATRATNLFTAAGKGLLRILGGWPGLIFTVITSLITFVDWETAAEKKARETAKALDLQTKALLDMDAAAREVARNDLIIQQTALEAKLKTTVSRINEYQEALQKARETGDINKHGFMETLNATGEGINKASGELRRYREELESVKVQLAALGAISGEGKDDEGEGDDIAQEFDSSNLDKEIEKLLELSQTYGMIQSEINEFNALKLATEERVKFESEKRTEAEIAAFDKKYKRFFQIFQLFNNKIKVEEKKVAEDKKKNEAQKASREKDWNARNQQSTARNIGAILGLEKEAALVSAGISLQRAIAKAMEKGVVGFAEVAAISGAFVGVMSSLRSMQAPGRAFGGTVSAGQATPINERGTPEMFVNNAGRQFLLPDQSGKVVPMTSGGGNSGTPNIIINNNAPGVEVEPTMSNGQIMLEIRKSEQRAVDQVNSSLAAGRGESAESLRSGFTQTRNI